MLTCNCITLAKVKLAGMGGQVKLGSGAVADILDSVGGGGADIFKWQGALLPRVCNRLQFWQMYLFQSTNHTGEIGTCLPMCVSTC